MTHSPLDIVINQSVTWLSQSYILRTIPGLNEARLRRERCEYKAGVAPSFKDRNILPNTRKAWRWALINEAFYYAYDNIPNKTPQNYRCYLPANGKLVELAKQTPAVESTPLQQFLVDFIEAHHTGYLACYNDCTKTQQEHLSKAAALTEGIIEYIRTANINIKKYTFFEQVGQFVKTNDIMYFPENPRVIKRKLEAFFTDKLPNCQIVELIKLPRAKNDNAAKDFNDDEIRAWILQLRHDGRNLTNAYIIRKIQEQCLLTCKPCPKDRWIGKIMEEHNTKFLTAAQRFGEKGRGATVYRGYQPFQNALHAGDCWQIDGTRVNMIDHRVEKDGSKPAHTQYLYIVAVRDVHSGYILGFDFCVNESHYTVTRALEMAANNAGYLPYELVCDQFPGHNTPAMVEMLNNLQQWGMKLTFSSDPNSKARMERWFGTLQTVFMQDSKMYYGQGIRSTRLYAHRSAEYLARMRKEAKAIGWNWDAAVAETTQIIDNYNNTAYAKWSRKHKTVQQTPAELHTLSARPYVVELKADDYNYLFGIKKKLQHTAGLIKTAINNLEYYFWITDYEVISKHGKVLCCFDYNDLTSCTLYAISDLPVKQFLGRAFQGDAAQPYGPEANWELIAKRRQLIKDNQDFAEQEYQYKTGTYDAVTLLAPMTVNKGTYEAAESIFLAPTVSNNTSLPFGEGRVGAGDDADFELTFNPRNQY
jgi:transposase InsO family protein